MPSPCAAALLFAATLTLFSDPARAAAAVPTSNPMDRALAQRGSEGEFGGDDPTTTLRFAQPARGFHASLPLGNGRLGAMVFGGVPEEWIVLNENSLWSGSPEEADRPNAHQALPEIRRLLREGKNVEAEQQVNAHFTCQGRGSGQAQGANLPYGSYQTLGRLRLQFTPESGATPVPAAAHPPAANDPLAALPATITDYSRILDLRSALARIEYRADGVKFTREHFVSAPDEVFVSRLTADVAGSLSFTILLDRPERFSTRAMADHELLMTGSLNDGRGGAGMRYAARLRALGRGGSIKAEGDRLVVVHADEVILLLTAATNYRGFAGRQLDDPIAATGRDLDRAAQKTFAALRAAQHTDHAGWFNRVDLQLPATPNSTLPTDQRLVGFAGGAADPALAALYFNYGRYLLISASRPGGLPANLQGLWAEEIQTPWNGDWHLNINVQMNYWPAEICQLSELHEPLHQLIASLVAPGRRTAQAYYHARGWVAHVITNPWGFTSPGESASWGASISGSAWLCHHLWEHYAFTLDRDFLRRIYPVLKESSLFYLDNLVEEPRHQWLVTGPSNSPENRFQLADGRTAHVCLGPTMDLQLLRELFGNTARAAEILGWDADLRQELAAKRARLAPNQISPDGRLQEWLEPYAEPEPTHRHTSHLYGLYPGYEITRRGTPALAEACRQSLHRRGDRSNGWALAWRMNLWARLGEGERAYQLLQMLLRPAAGGSGSLPNLFDSCPPFQIDGNFGGCAGIAEMLLQSHAGEIELLPALPKAWPQGAVKGLKARGNLMVDFEWRDGQVTAYRLRSPHPQPVSLRVNRENRTLTPETN